MLINSLNRRTVSKEQDTSLNISYYVKKKLRQEAL